MPLPEEKINILRELGQEIRARREELGLTFEDVYQKTRIQLSYLDALENANYEILPSPVYTLGFIRTYLGILEFNDLYPEFRHWLLKGTRKQEKDRGEMLGPYATPSPGFKLASRFWVFVVLMLIVFGAMAYVAIKWSENGIPNIAIRNEQRPPDQLSAAVDDEVSEDVKSDDISEDESESDNVPEPEPAPPPEPAKPELQIIASHDDCWISIRVGNGRVLDRTLRRGESFTMELTAMTRVSYGRPWAVTVIHNGRDIGSPYRSGPRRPQVNVYYPDGRSGRLETPQQP